MRVLVTGAKGFSGSHVAEYLTRSGHDVETLDRYQIGPAAIDAIVHIAGTYPQAGTHPGKLVDDNVIFTKVLIDSAREWGCKKFIFFSSLSVLGDVKAIVVDGTTPVSNPTTYGTTKLICEQMLNDVALELPSVSLRLPGIVGVGAHFNWLSRTATHIANGELVPAYSLDAMFNNAVHIEDLCAFIDHLLEADWGGNRSIVLGAKGAMSIREVIGRLGKGIGVAPKMQSLGDTHTFILDSGRATRYYGYQPASIESIIDRYAMDVRQY